MSRTRFIAQKAVGLGIVALGILSACVDGDGTFMVLSFIFGGYLFFTKDRCLDVELKGDEYDEYKG